MAAYLSLPRAAPAYRHVLCMASLPPAWRHTEALPGGAASGGGYPGRISALANVVQLGGGDVSGPLVKSGGCNLRSIAKKAMGRILLGIAWAVFGPTSRAYHLVQENLCNSMPIRLVVSQMPAAFVLVERWAELKAGRQGDGESSVVFDEPDLGV